MAKPIEELIALTQDEHAAAVTSTASASATERGLTLTMKNRIINRPHPGLFWRVIIRNLRAAELDIGPERARAVVREHFKIMRREYRATPEPWVPFPVNAD